MFGSAVETIGKELGLGQSLHMRSMKAAYYPVWRVDAIAENGPEGRDGWLAVREGYVPGNPFAPLAYLSYAVPPLSDDLAPYDRRRDLNQIPGHDIVEVPFTVDPIRFADRVRERVGRTEIGGVAIDASKWKEVMVSMTDAGRQAGRLARPAASPRGGLTSLGPRTTAKLTAARGVPDLLPAVPGRV